MLAHNSQEIAEAYEKLEILSKNPKKRIEYEARKMQLLDEWLGTSTPFSHHKRVSTALK